MNGFFLYITMVEKQLKDVYHPWAVFLVDSSGIWQLRDLTAHWLFFFCTPRGCFSDTSRITFFSSFLEDQTTKTHKDTQRHEITSLTCAIVRMSFTCPKNVICKHPWQVYKTSLKNENIILTLLKKQVWHVCKISLNCNLNILTLYNKHP